MIRNPDAVKGEKQVEKIWCAETVLARNMSRKQKCFSEKKAARLGAIAETRPALR